MSAEAMSKFIVSAIKVRLENFLIQRNNMFPNVSKEQKERWIEGCSNYILNELGNTKKMLIMLDLVNAYSYSKIINNIFDKMKPEDINKKEVLKDGL